MQYSCGAAKYALEKICGKFDAIITKYNINRDDLYGGGKIYYMNANDGTEFDWKMNDHACEFYIFFANERGFCKIYAESDGYIRGYVFPDGGQKSAENFKEYIGVDSAESLAILMLVAADKRHRWDEDIEPIIKYADKYDITYSDYYELDDDEDEEEDW